MCQRGDEIVICMGSSCFSRGNGQNAEALLAYLRDRGLSDTIQVTGTLCQDLCKQGPNLTVNGECFCGVDFDTLPHLLDEFFARRGQLAR